MSAYQNPFPPETDRYELWDMLVRRDIEAFIHSDWGMVAHDFNHDGFTAVDARGYDNPDSWALTFSGVDAYRDSWLRQSHDMLQQITPEKLRAALIEATTLRDIEINTDAALVHKKFDGQVVTDQRVIRLQWQTLYQCRKISGAWKIAGFIGYLPHPMGHYERPVPTKTFPVSGQHVTAGPYSPVIQINPQALVVISGQAALDASGAVVGESIEEQARVTLMNCDQQLRAAGCDLSDVFKVNVFLIDLGEWQRFNEVYRAIMPQPYPVRTAIQAQLLPGLRVEIEMWAVKS